MKVIFTFLSCMCFSSYMLFSQTTLNADGPGNTYELITSVLAPGANPVETPDCSHPGFGRHIEEVWDAELGTNVFVFHIHTNEDDDRCINFDRQRNEIKTYDQSPDNLKGVLGETVVYKWKFKLDAGFQPSSSFTHLHQIKAVGGTEDGMPQITLTARAGSPEKLELRYAETNTQVIIATADLSTFKGVWAEATETITYGEPGSYNLSIIKISDGSTLFSYSDSSIRMWKTAADFMRPKWGIYRSLNNSQQLRDESVLFADFYIEEIVSNGNCSFAASFNPSTLTHSGTGASTSTVSFPSNSENVSFTISNINEKLNGPSSKKYIEEVTVSYVNGIGNTIVHSMYNGTNHSNALVEINGAVQSVTVSLTDILDGDTGNTNMSISLTEANYCQAGPCTDSDGDGVCDGADACPGFDDNLDADGDGIPDGCDDCNTAFSDFSLNPLTHSGTGSTSTIINLTNQEDISFSISGLGKKTNGNPNNKYIDIVEVTYVDGTGSTVSLGTFSGINQSTVNIVIVGIVTQITVSLSDGYDGNAPNISVNLSQVESCEIAAPQSLVIFEDDSIQSKEFKIFPNPFDESFTINIPNDFVGNNVEETVYIFNAIGQYYDSFDYRRGDKILVNTNNWLPGIYFVKMGTVEHSFTQRIVKGK